MGAPTLYSQNMICLMNSNPPASHGNRIPEAFFRHLKFHVSTSGTWFVGFVGSNSLVV